MRPPPETEAELDRFKAHLGAITFDRVFLNARDRLEDAYDVLELPQHLDQNTLYDLVRKIRRSDMNVAVVHVLAERGYHGDAPPKYYVEPEFACKRETEPDYVFVRVGGYMLRCVDVEGFFCKFYGQRHATLTKYCFGCFVLFKDRPLYLRHHCIKSKLCMPAVGSDPTVTSYWAECAQKRFYLDIESTMEPLVDFEEAQRLIVDAAGNFNLHVRETTRWRLTRDRCEPMFGPRELKLAREGEKVIDVGRRRYVRENGRWRAFQMESTPAWRYEGVYDRHALHLTKGELAKLASGVPSITRQAKKRRFINEHRPFQLVVSDKDELTDVICFSHYSPDNWEFAAEVIFGNFRVWVEQLFMRYRAANEDVDSHRHVTFEFLAHNGSRYDFQFIYNVFMSGILKGTLRWFEAKSIHVSPNNSVQLEFKKWSGFRQPANAEGVASCAMNIIRFRDTMRFFNTSLAAMSASLVKSKPFDHVCFDKVKSLYARWGWPVDAQNYRERLVKLSFPFDYISDPTMLLATEYPPFEWFDGKKEQHVYDYEKLYFDKCGNFITYSLRYCCVDTVLLETFMETVNYDLMTMSVNNLRESIAAFTVDDLKSCPHPNYKRYCEAIFGDTKLQVLPQNFEFKFHSEYVREQMQKLDEEVRVDAHPRQLFVHPIFSKPTIGSYAYNTMIDNAREPVVLLTDVDAASAFKQAIRGGMSDGTQIYTKICENATAITVLDVRQLYTSCLLSLLVTGDIRECEMTRFPPPGFDMYASTAYLLCVDVDLSSCDEDVLNEVYILPEHVEVDGGKRLATHLRNRSHYWVMSCELISCMPFGITISKIHKCYSFRQTALFARPVHKATLLRTVAKRDGNIPLSDFAKTFNNVTYGKFLEQSDKYRQCKVIQNVEVDKYLTRSSTRSMHSFGEDYSIVTQQPSRVTCDKPFHIAANILGLAKCVMNQMQYLLYRVSKNDRAMIPRQRDAFKQTARSVYMDTDSAFIAMHGTHIYKLLLPYLHAMCEFSTLPRQLFDALPLFNKERYLRSNFGVPGMFGDDLAGGIGLELVVCKPKTYSIKWLDPCPEGLIEREKVKAKGIPKSSAAGVLNGNVFYDAFFNEGDIPVVEQRNFERRNKRMYTIVQKKRTFTKRASKRVTVGNLHVAYGHSSLTVEQDSLMVIPQVHSTEKFFHDRVITMPNKLVHNMR